MVKVNRQSGFVSLFTVIFFMLLLTVITIGFLRIMGIEQQQSLDNDLTASALAAAESGVEDGKRAILAYKNTSDATLKSALGTAFGSTSCNSLTNSATIRSALGFDAGGNIIGNTQSNQYYTCLTVNLKSPDYINASNAGVSDFVPLITDDPAGYETVKVSWHLISQSVTEEGDGIPVRYSDAANGNYLRPLVNVTGNATNSWTSQGYPAYLRVQLYGYPTGGSFTRTDLDNRSRTMMLIPSSSAAAVPENTPINFETVDPRGVNQNKSSLQQISCKPSPATQIGSYACAATLALPTSAGLTSSGNSYFLRITPIYGKTHFSLILQHNGAAVNFNGVQPIIDVTGRAADVFRRLQARVRINPPGILPEFSAESANTICKNMVVSDGSYYVANTCP